MSDNDPDREAALLDRVLLLTATFECGSHYGDPGEVQDAFMYVLKRFPHNVAIEAIDRFMMGRGDGQLPNVLPTAAEVAVECRQLVYLEEAVGFDAGGDLGSPVVRVDEASQPDVPVFEDFADGLYETPDGKRRYHMGGRVFMLVPVDGSPSAAAPKAAPSHGSDNVILLKRPPNGAA
jgi:hypothetical protein